MALTLVTAPAEEPITLGEAKAQMRVDGTDEDDYILGLIVAARRYCERVHQRRALITQTWDWRLDSFPGSYGTLEVPKPPLQSVVKIDYLDTAGATQTLAASKYLVDAKSEPGRITPAYGESWPPTREQVNAVLVQFVAGYGLSIAVPETTKNGLALLVAHWFEIREPIITGTIVAKVPLSVEALLDGEKVYRYR